MKKLSLLMVLFLSVALTSVHATKKVTLTVACFSSFDRAFSELLPNFHKKYPNIEVKIIAQGYGDHHNGIVTSLASGDGLPDAAVVEIGYFAQFVASGGFEDLNQRPYRAGKYRRKMAPYKWVQATDDLGRLIGFPLDIAPACAYWRRDRFAEAGVDIEAIKTMDDLFVAAGKLTRDTDGDGKIDQWFTSDASNIAQMILRSSSKKIFTSYKRRFVKWELEDVKTAFTWAQRFRQAGYDARIGAWTNDWYRSFQNGTIAYEVSGAWLGGHLQNWLAPKTSGQWGVARFPALNAGEKPLAGNWGGSFMGIPQKAAHKNEAWKFIQFICINKSHQLSMYKSADAFPAYIPAWSDPIFDEKVEFLAGQQARRLWIEIAKEIPEVRTNRFDNVILAIFGNELQEVLDTNKNVDKAIKDATSQVDT